MAPTRADAACIAEMPGSTRMSSARQASGPASTCSSTADATSTGDWPRIVLGVGLMSVFVVTLNHIVWKPLYRLAQTRFQLS